MPMSNVVREDINPTQVLLTVRLPRAEYEPKFLKKLKEYRQKMQIRGFRKGMAPMGMLRKLYGQSLLAELVTDELNRSLFDYLKEEQIDYLAEPMIKEDDLILDFDINELKDYQVKFDLGLRPQFDLQGWGASSTVKYPIITPTDEELDRLIDSVRKEHGDREELHEGQPLEHDLVELHLEEWEEGAKKEGGVHSHAVIGLEEELEAAFRQELLTKAVGDTFMVDPYQIEKDRSEKWVKEHILHLPETAPETSRTFMASIEKIIRITPAELNEAFFQKVSGDDDIRDEQAYRDLWKARFPEYFKRDVQAFLSMQMRHHLLNANPIPLPEEILRRWAVQRAAEEKEPREWSEQELDDFVQNIRYSILIDVIAREQQIQVSHQDLLRAQMEELFNYFGSSADPNMLGQLANNLLQDEETRNKLGQQVHHQKIVSAFYEVATLEKEEVHSTNLNTWLTTEVQKFEDSNEPAQVS
jgi:trigger factor